MPKIVTLPGDGIGREVMAACLELLAAAEAASGGPALRLTRLDEDAVEVVDLNRKFTHKVVVPDADEGTTVTLEKGGA